MMERPFSFNREEVMFIRRAIKDELAMMNAERTLVSDSADMVNLMRIEEELKTAEGAWEKLKRLL